MKYTITRLEVVDFKRIEAAAITPDGNVLLTGDNGQGKSSVLDAIMWGLTRKGTDKPIHAGTEQATVALTLSDGQDVAYTIRRREKDGGGHYLDVLDSEGGKVASPQKFLDSLVGNLAFDPEEFARLKPKDQADALRKAVGLDTSDLDDEHKTVFAQRTEANRVKDSAEKLYKACPIVAGGPRDLASAAELLADRNTLLGEIESSKEIAETVILARRHSAELRDQITTLKAQLERAEAQLEENEVQLAKETALADDAAKATEGHQQRLDEIDAQLKNIDQTNAEAQAHNKALTDRDEKKASYTAAVTRWTQLDNRIKELAALREERIAACNFPVPGLSIEDDTVLVNGIPFADLNTAERIKLSALIAMAQNPTLKVIFIREGALISRQNLAVLAELAEAHGAQLWMEVFSETPREKGFHIVEGGVALVDGKPAPASQLELI